MRLKPHISSRRPRQRSVERGWTLPEMLVAMAAGAIIMAAVVSTAITLSTTMVAIANYNDLDQHSRNTLDTMGRDLRNTAMVTLLATNSITVSNSLTGDLVTYRWDGSNAFNRVFNGASTMMLTNCDYLSFSGFQRNPTNNFQFIAASTPSQTKLLSVSWRCSRTVLGIKLNTESVQTAKICVRN